jgi:hypothetical protein
MSSLFLKGKEEIAGGCRVGQEQKELFFACFTYDDIRGILFKSPIAFKEARNEIG